MGCPAGESRCSTLKCGVALELLGITVLVMSWLSARLISVSPIFLAIYGHGHSPGARPCCDRRAGQWPTPWSHGRWAMSPAVAALRRHTWSYSQSDIYAEGAAMRPRGRFAMPAPMRPGAARSLRGPRDDPAARA